MADRYCHPIIAVIDNDNPPPHPLDCVRPSRPPFVILNHYALRMYAMPPGSRLGRDSPRGSKLLDRGENTVVVNFWDSIPEVIEIASEANVTLKSLKMIRRGEEIDLLDGATIYRTPEILMRNPPSEPVRNGGGDIKIQGGKNVALTVVAFAVLAIGIYLLYLQLNPVVTAVIESETETKITVQVLSCNDVSITKAPFTEKRIYPGKNVVTVHPTGAPKLVRIMRSSNVGPPPAINLSELTLSKISKVDLLKGASVVSMPLLVTDANQPETLAAEVIPIPIKAVRNTEIHVSESIHQC